MGNQSGTNNPSYRHGHNHRGNRSTEYEIWAGIKARCTNPKHKLYPYYGGRGIKMCHTWSQFSNFLSDIGNRPGKDWSLDRINNDGNYSKNNCRWATRTQQSRNRRNNLIIEHDGQHYCLKEFCLIHNLSYKNVWRRIKQYGWSVERSTEVKGACLGKTQ